MVLDGLDLGSLDDDVGVQTMLEAVGLAGLGQHHAVLVLVLVLVTHSQAAATKADRVLQLSAEGIC